MKLKVLPGSLVGRIVLVGILLVVVAGLTRYLLVARAVRSDLIEVVSGQQSALAQAIARDVDYKVRQRQRLVDALAVAIPRDMLFDPLRLRPWLEERLQLQPLFGNGILVLDMNGTVRVDAPMLPDRVGSSIAQNLDFLAAREGRASIGHPVISRLTKMPVMPFASPVRDARGNVIAVLIGTSRLDAPDFLDRLQHERIGKTGGFLLISPRDRLFVSADDPKLVLQPTPAAGVNPMHDRAMAGFRGTGVTVNAAGVEEISAVASVPAAGWFVVARIQTVEALAAIEQTRSFIIRYSVIELLVAAAVVGLLSARVLRPLHHAAEQSKRMTEGRAPLSPMRVIRDDEVGHLTGAFNRLISKLSETQNRLEYMAHHDQLTGLLNRNVVAERIELALNDVARSGHLAALLYIDLDGFKAVNDELGHGVGDRFLQQTAIRLGSVTRRSDILARLGGDEFILFVPDIVRVTDTAELHVVESLAQKVIDLLSLPIGADGVSRAMGASIGIALSDGQTSVEVMMAQADAAMYEAKRLGRRRFVIAPWRGSSAVTTQ